MEISQLEDFDDTAMAEQLDLTRAVQAFDRPEAPGSCSIAHAATFRNPGPDSLVRRWVVRMDDRPVARLTLDLPVRDNTHLSEVEIVVHPEYRRRGIGRRMMEVGLDIAGEAGRRTCGSAAIVGWPGGADRSDHGDRFLTALGFERALTEVVRRTDVTAIDPAREQELYDRSVAKSAGYEIIGWTGRTPEDLLDGLGRLNSTFLTEAPTGGLDLEAQNIDADRIRGYDDRNLERGILTCGVAARHPGTGDIVADTAIAVFTEPGDHAEQWITLVAPEHRGHALGLRLKLENHRQLRVARPEVRWVWTGNADGNDHMIAINEQLGFEIVDAHAEYQRKLTP